MRKNMISLVVSCVAVAACTTYPAPVRPVATADAANVCGNYGYVDVNNDGYITGNEWNTYRSSTYNYWDTNGDGRISQSEFEHCYRAGGFYRTGYYNPDYWPQYWSSFDDNRDGYLSADEYWSANAWARIDRNLNGRIDANEWLWWSM